MVVLGSIGEHVDFGIQNLENATHATVNSFLQINIFAGFSYIHVVVHVVPINITRRWCLKLIEKFDFTLNSIGNQRNRLDGERN